MWGRGEVSGALSDGAGRGTMLRDEEVLEIVEACRDKVETVRSLVDKRYGARLTGDEVDLMIATYAFGLTMPLFEEQAAEAHLQVIRACLRLVMPSDRVERAMSTTSVTPRAAPVLAPIELIGNRDGRAMFGTVSQ